MFFSWTTCSTGTSVWPEPSLLPGCCSAAVTAVWGHSEVRTTAGCSGIPGMLWQPGNPVMCCGTPRMLSRIPGKPRDPKAAARWVGPGGCAGMSERVRGCRGGRAGAVAGPALPGAAPAGGAARARPQRPQRRRPREPPEAGGRRGPARARRPALPPRRFASEMRRAPAGLGWLWMFNCGRGRDWVSEGVGSRSLWNVLTAGEEPLQGQNLHAQKIRDSWVVFS